MRSFELWLYPRLAQEVEAFPDDTALWQAPAGLTASVGVNIAGYSDDQIYVLRHKILEQVSVLPGVEVASLTDWVPLTLSRQSVDAYPDGYVPHPHESLEVGSADVTARYFETMHIQIPEGRAFSLNGFPKRTCCREMPCWGTQSYLLPEALYWGIFLPPPDILSLR